MTGAYADVSAIEQQIIAESLRRVASVRPDIAMVMAQALETDEGELSRLAHILTPEEAAFAFSLMAQ